MTALTRPLRRLIGRADVTGRRPLVGRRPPTPARRAGLAGPRHRHPRSDPLLAYLQSAPGPVDVARLELHVPGASTRCATPGVALVVPLVRRVS